MAVTASTHAADQIVGLEETLPVRTAELAALVGVDHHLLLGLAPPHRHQQGIDGQLGQTDSTIRQNS